MRPKFKMRSVTNVFGAEEENIVLYHFCSSVSNCQDSSICSCFCVPVAIPVISLFRSCVVVFTATVSLKFLPVNGRPMTVRKERRWQVKYGREASCKNCYSLMVAKTGTVVSARRRTCGQDRSVAGCQTNIPSVLQGTHMQAVSIVIIM